jgi:tRNA G18 (ribose-2'-O)-methylase SpoU
VVERVGDARDPRTAEYAHVGDPEWLRTHGLFVAEGRLVVERLVLGGRFKIRSILLTPAALDRMTAALAGLPCPVYVASQDTLESLTGFDFHRGCLALAEREATVASVNALAGAQRLLCMEGVANPDNVGGLFRIAEAFGADSVLLDPSSGDPLYRKAIRTSMGAVLRLPFVRSSAWPGVLTMLRDDGFTVVALTPQPPAVLLNEYARSRQLTDRLIVIVGAEGSGLSHAALEHADVRVRIRIAPAVDSLNVVVAAGIALATLWPVS